MEVELAEEADTGYHLGAKTVGKTGPWTCLSWEAGGSESWGPSWLGGGLAEEQSLCGSLCTVH